MLLTEFILTLLVRMIEGLWSAAPTLLVGLLVAAALRGACAAQTLRHWLNRPGWQSIPRGIAFAFLTPTCALGALPIARVWHAAGVDRGALVAFLVAAPLLNPISLTYGLALLSFPLWITLVGSAVLAAVLAGLAVQRWQAAQHASTDWQPPAAGLQRLYSSAKAAACIAAGVWIAEIGGALLVAGTGAFLLPHDFITDRVNSDNVWAPAWMLLGASPAYLSPNVGMMAIGGMEQSGMSLPAAVCLFLMGVGTTAATWPLLANILGVCRAAVVFSTLLLTLVTCSFAPGMVLPIQVGPAEHSHAIDMLMEPVVQTDLSSESLLLSLKQGLRYQDSNAGLVVALLILLAGWGIVLRLTAPRLGAPAISSSETAPETPTPSVSGARWWEQPISPGVASGLAVILLLGTMVYVYYPSPVEIFEDLRIARVNLESAVHLKKSAEAERALRQLEAAAAMLPVGALLRGQSSSTASEATASLHTAVAEVRIAIVAPDWPTAAQRTEHLVRSYYNCKLAYLGSDSL